MAGKKKVQRFGGRATAAGVGYEARVAARLAVKLLRGRKALVWPDVHGGNLEAITLQSANAVDDVVVDIAGVKNLDRVHLSAKDRADTIALTAGSAAFADTIRDFVAQYLARSRKGVRLGWTVPTSAGKNATRHLLQALDSFRRDAGDLPLTRFIAGRGPKEADALRAVRSLVRPAWKKIKKRPPSDAELKDLLRTMFVEVLDIGHGLAHERDAEAEIRDHLAADPHDSERIWRFLTQHFEDANRRGLRVTADSLRRDLKAAGLRLQAAADYAADLTLVRIITDRSVARLAEHARLPFGPTAQDRIAVARPTEVEALLAAAGQGHHLVTGEPGGGKSGLLFALAESLRAGGTPCVLLLAEEVFDPTLPNLGQLQHAFDDVLTQWPDGARGVVITDALDAVRDADMQKRVRELLHSVQQGKSGWTVVASVREFDLKHGRELREAFPGNGVIGYASDDFIGVAHFHVPRFTEAQVDQLAAQRPEIAPFIQSARANPRSADLHRSPFYLRLAATLLRDGVPPQRLADWNSPAVLLRRFWQDRVGDGPGGSARQRALKAISAAIVEQRTMSLSEKALNLSDDELRAVAELRSRGILQGPGLKFSTLVNTDHVGFAHHLLHDYAITRSLVPETADAFVDYVTRHPLQPIFYRQSFVFALEELWDADPSHTAFWSAALRLEREPKLHGITRLLAPILAARRVRTGADLAPLLTAVQTSSAADAAGPKALVHLTSGLEDANDAHVREGAEAWCEAVAQLASLLATRPFLEPSVVRLLARVRKVGCGTTPAQRIALNMAARRLLAHHASKPVNEGWPYAGMIAIEALCGTFSAAPLESEVALLALLAPDRLKDHPSADLGEIASHLGDLPPAGAEVVRRLYQAAFATEPARGQLRQAGSHILGLTMQTSDDWNNVHYRLAEHYRKSDGADSATLTEAACHAWGAVYRRHYLERGRPQSTAAAITFRSRTCTIPVDHSHMGQRRFEHEEGRILSRFEELLRQWAGETDPARLHAALDRFAACNPPALMWTLLMDAGADRPTTLGLLLVDLLDEPSFPVQFDLHHAADRLFGALHRIGDAALRARLESIALELPLRAALREGEQRLPVPERLQAAQDGLLAQLPEANLVRPDMVVLWRARDAAGALGRGDPSADFSVSSRVRSAREGMKLSGIDLKETANEEMFQLREKLQAVLATNKAPDAAAVADIWLVLLESERAVQRHRAAQPAMATQLWNYLLNVCEKIVRAMQWPRRDRRWHFLRTVLLRATRFPAPCRTKEEEDDDGPGVGWGTARAEAAQGLAVLAHRLGGADRGMATALRRLAKDPARGVRWCLARDLAALEQHSPKLMWLLFDRFIADEKNFSVFEGLIDSLDRLWARHPLEVHARLRLIAKKTARAPASHKVHDGLVRSHFCEYLRSGRKVSEAYLQRLLRRIDQPTAGDALSEQVGASRMEDLFTAGPTGKPDARLEAIRGRTWSIVEQLLDAAQQRLAAARARFEAEFTANSGDNDATTKLRATIKHLNMIVDNVGMQLFFASGAHDEKVKPGTDGLTDDQVRRFWTEARPLLTKLADEMHPHTSYHLVQTLHHLLPFDPRETFLLAVRSLRGASAGRMQHEQLAVPVVVKLIQRMLADHRHIFRSPVGQENECLTALLDVLDLFVEAGWPEARQLTNRLEEIYR